MTYHPDDTICAIATAAGGAARGIIRVSGSRAVDVAAVCFEAMDGRPLRGMRRAERLAGSLRIELATGAKSQAVPCDLLAWPTSRSYTREPVVELHTLGSPPILEAALATVCRSGARPAEPGEFTLRAFLAGRVDLTQAEAVLGVIDAHGEGELSVALAQLAGGLARHLYETRDLLLQLLAELEAGLDFVEEDIQFVTAEELVAQLESAHERLADIARQMTQRGTAGTISRVVLIGLPNAGKSSLFNALVERFGVAPTTKNRTAPALVSPRRGTTRDYVTAVIELGNARCELVDTAGVDALVTHVRLEAGHPAGVLHESAKWIANQQRERAAIRVWCVEVGENDPSQIRDLVDMNASDCNLVVVTKSDLVPKPSPVSSYRSIIATSVVTGEGLVELGATLSGLLGREPGKPRGLVLAATAGRCRESVRLAKEALQRAIAVAVEDGGGELVAAELRDALTELGKVVGAVYTEDLLDRIFKTFCIGK